MADELLSPQEQRDALARQAVLIAEVKALKERIGQLEDSQRWMVRSLIALVFVVVVANLMTETLIGG